MSNPIHAETRCTAKRKSGGPCKNRPILGGAVCRMHGGGAPQVKKKAAERIAEAADDAAALLVQFMENPKNDVKVRTQIAQDLLNRAGHSGKQAVDLQMTVFDHAVANGDFLVDVGEIGDSNDLPVLEAPAVEEPPLKLHKRGGKRKQ